MSDLLQLALDAHGGLDRWREATKVTAEIEVGGATWAKKGVQDKVFVTAATATVEPHRESTRFVPFAGGATAVFRPDLVTLEDAEGNEVERLEHPRSTFAQHELSTPWSVPQAAYFGGYAMWTYLTTPFLLAEPGVSTREIDPWHENGETWRVLEAEFPDSIATHSTRQFFYFGPDGLLRRTDYTVEIFGAGIQRSAHYTRLPKVFDGFTFPTERRVVPRKPDNTTLDGPQLVTIDVKHVEVR
ncbi:hypothetical protein ACQPXM_07440 [Kribbella sp. CA-253562]|uniref:hypothetical protein n=1 Tax=Kribbella sp. CA-253562 TaxID=3239942 RepID=UPI003D92384B